MTAYEVLQRKDWGRKVIEALEVTIANDNHRANCASQKWDVRPCDCDFGVAANALEALNAANVDGYTCGLALILLDIKDA